MSWLCMEMGFAAMNIDEMKKRTLRWVGSSWRSICRVGQEGPRRVIHAVKVGFSLTLVSLLYLMEPLFKDIGQNAIWAVMTVVLVLQFTAGATLCKGFNRGLGTLLAGSLAFLMDFIAQESGPVFQAIFIGTSVFAIGAAATYIRFIPDVKKNYDYGVVIFLATFNLITVSSYRVDNVLQIARAPFYTVGMGCAICLLMSLFVFPIWSGRDLHNSSVSKLQGLAYSIQVRALFKDPCTRVAAELHKSLIELANSIRERRQCTPVVLSDHLHHALQDLDAALESQPLTTTIPTAKRTMEGKSSLRSTLSKVAITNLELSEALPFAAFASLLVEAVARLDLVIEEVEELGRGANFREFCGKDEHLADGVINGSRLDNHFPTNTNTLDC